MAESKLKIKIGDHEFEAEGPTEIVNAQLAAFKELIAALPPSKAEISASISSQEPTVQAVAQPAPLNVDKIFDVEGRVISLTARPENETDAVMLILYGQRRYRGNENPTGSEIVDGMEQSGYRLVRIDRILTALDKEGAVNISGAHRGKRYRLTNQGVAKAENIAREVLAKIA